jgi:dienelactone hydrolase
MNTSRLAPHRTGATTREPVVLVNEGQKLIGVVHRPAGGAEAALPAVLILHGLVGSKDQPHQLYVKLAEALARAGMLSLRIDLRGRGDSEGETVDVTPDADLSDAAKALDYLAGHPAVDSTRLAVVGHSWGGTLAACLAGRDPRVSCVVMWGSVPGGLRHWMPEFREIDGRQVAELWGNLLGRAFFEEWRTIHTLEELTKAGVPLLILCGTQDEEARGIEEAGQALARAGVPHEVVTIDGADHVFMRYEWEREAIERTVEWLRRSLQSGVGGTAAGTRVADRLETPTGR